MTGLTRRSVIAAAAVLAAAPGRAAIDAAAFNVRGDGEHDDTAALQAAIDALGPAGGTLRLAKGVYRVRAPAGSTACLTARCGLRLIGEGAMQTIIRPETPGADALLIVPSPVWAADFTRVEAVFIGDHRNGKRIGRHGIRVVTRSAGAHIPHFALIDTYIGAGEGAAFAHENDPAANPNGGVYAATIAGCTLSGGVVLSQSGDSIVVRENIITGGGIGIDATLIKGSSLLSILDNNITTLRGAVRIRGGARIDILRNNCEHQRPSPGGICVDLDGGIPIVGGTIAQNLLSTFTGTGFAELLRLRNAFGIAVEGNCFAAGSPGVVGINIGPGCRDIRVGSNVWNANVRPRLVDPVRTVRGDPSRDAQSPE